MAVQRNQ
jgi:hypothetical protein